MQYIVADNDEEYSADTYHETTKAVGNQQWVANHWADGALPTHSTSGKRVKLNSPTGNFRGIQFTDGKGKLLHYAHIEAIRTYSGLIISDTSCYAKGWAHCSTPNHVDHQIDLTSLQGQIRNSSETIYDIEDINDSVVEFSSGQKYDMESQLWVAQQSQKVGALGV